MELDMDTEITVAGYPSLHGVMADPQTHMVPSQEAPSQVSLLQMVSLAKIWSLLAMLQCSVRRSSTDQLGVHPYALVPLLYFR